jgi:hypothetical protein
MKPPLTKIIEGTLRRELRSLVLELEAYPDERLIWVMPPGCPNAAGNLALHLAGNISHYIGAVLGGTGYVRDRDHEFGARDVPRSEIVERILAADGAVRLTLPGLTEADLLRPYPETIRDTVLETGDFLVHLAVHLGYHLGQLSYHRRLVTGDPTGVGSLAASQLSSARTTSNDDREGAG